MNITITSDEMTSATPITLKRGCLFYLKRGMRWAGIVILLLVVSGVVYQLSATEMDRRAFHPTGQLVNVDGHDMHIHCMGEGSPTVILEAGGYSYSSEWYWVERQTAATNRVCAYDRAGMGWSEPSSALRTGSQVVHDLRTLLANAGEKGPYVLAGHSYGGVINRIYAFQYPDEVLGIVLVDSAIMLPDTFANQGEFDQWKRENDVLQGIIWAASRTGIYRLMIPDTVASWGYPSEVAREIAALRSSNGAFDTYYAEAVAARWKLTEEGEAAQNLGDLPLLILWATEIPQLSAADSVRYAELQASLAMYSTNSATLFVQGADHGSIIGKEEYALQVSSAIRDVIDSANNKLPLTQ